MPTILNRFLAANLLPIGDDDEKLEFLEAAATDLGKRLEGTPILAYRFGLIGFDEKAAATDPICTLVADVVASKWQTIANKVGSSPVQIYRAVMLRALEIVAAKRPEFRQAILLLARNQPTAVVEGGATKPIAEMLAELETPISEEESRDWVNAVDLSLPKLSTKLKKPGGNKEELSIAIGRAVGPTDKEGKALPTPNPHWPNAGQPWGLEFVPRATEAVHAAVQTAAKAVADEMQEALRETVIGWSDALQRLAIRDAKSELLWIRASLYSPSAGAGYRELKPAALCLHAALDTSRAVSASAPTSVEYFLRELVTSQTRDRARLAELLSAVSPSLKKLSEGQAITAAEAHIPADGRRSWLDYALRPAATDAAFTEQTGVPATFDDALAEIAVKFYRELQIRKLLSTGS
jgi:hypothetical protein